jgi:hypothetical protein
VTAKVAEAAKKVRDDAVRSAPRETLEELFQDFYQHRYQLYVMNLLRGVFFGVGTVIGGTLFVALLIWLLSLFNQVPLIGDFVETVKHSIESSRQQ